MMRLYENKERKGTENEKKLTLTLPNEQATLGVSNKSSNKSINAVLKLPAFKKFNLDGSSDLKIFFEEPILLGDKLFFIEVVCNCNPLASENYKEAFDNSRNNQFNQSLDLKVSSFKTSNVKLPIKLNFLTNFVSNYTNIMTIHSPSFMLYGDMTFDDLEKTIKGEIKKVYEEEYSKEVISEQDRIGKTTQNNDIMLPEKTPFESIVSPVVKFDGKNHYFKLYDKYLKLNIVNDNSLELKESEIKIDDKEINFRINLGDNDAFSQKEFLIYFYDEIIKRFNDRIPKLMQPKIDKIIKTFFKIVRTTNINDFKGKEYNEKTKKEEEVDLRPGRLKKILVDFELIYDGKKIKEISDILKIQTFDEKKLKIIDLNNKKYQIQTFNPFVNSLKYSLDRIIYSQKDNDQKQASVDNDMSIFEALQGRVNGINFQNSGIKNSLLLPPNFLYEHSLKLKLLLEHELNHFIWTSEIKKNIVQIKEQDNNVNIWKPKNLKGKFFINMVDKQHSFGFYQSLATSFKDPLAFFIEPLNYLMFEEEKRKKGLSQEYLEFKKIRESYFNTKHVNQEKASKILKDMAKKYYNIDINDKEYLKDFSLNDIEGKNQVKKIKKEKSR